MSEIPVLPPGESLTTWRLGCLEKQAEKLDGTVNGLKNQVSDLDKKVTVLVTGNESWKGILRAYFAPIFVAIVVALLLSKLGL